jgi:regulatory protein
MHYPDFFIFTVVQKIKKHLSVTQAKQSIYRYCAFQERCHSEVKNKLYEFGLNQQEVEEMLSELITQGFLNEERFAKSFAGGKFRMKHWGRLKIVNQLEAKGLTLNCIKSGLKEIDEKSYHETLVQILKKKWDQVSEENLYIKKDNVASFAIQKGYEPEMVWKVIKEEMNI